MRKLNIDKLYILTHSIDRIISVHCEKPFQLNIRLFISGTRNIKLRMRNMLGQTCVVSLDRGAITQ